MSEQEKTRISAADRLRQERERVERKREQDVVQTRQQLIAGMIEMVEGNERLSKKASSVRSNENALTQDRARLQTQIRDLQQDVHELEVSIPNLNAEIQAAEASETATEPTVKELIAEAKEELTRDIATLTRKKAELQQLEITVPDVYNVYKEFDEQQDAAAQHRVEFAVDTYREQSQETNNPITIPREELIAEVRAELDERYRKRLQQEAQEREEGAERVYRAFLEQAEQELDTVLIQLKVEVKRIEDELNSEAFSTKIKAQHARITQLLGERFYFKKEARTEAARQEANRIKKELIGLQDGLYPGVNQVYEKINGFFGKYQHAQVIDDHFVRLDEEFHSYDFEGGTRNSQYRKLEQARAQLNGRASRELRKIRTYCETELSGRIEGIKYTDN